MRALVPLIAAVTLSSCATLSGAPGVATTEHYVHVKSTAPAILGADASIYVREIAPSASTADARRVVLFVHGSGTPAEVSFDVPYADYSWMAYLARAGFDTFSMDMTGYGRSTRPPQMADPCFLSKVQQGQMGAGVIKAPCAPAPATPLSTMDSDWDDIGAVVDHLRAARHVDKVSLVGWSQGGPRAAGYAARHPEKVDRLVVLAPSYVRTGPMQAPNPLASTGAPMSKQSREDFDKNWDRQVGCPGQYERAASDSVWTEMLASDPVGAGWAPGVRRAPNVPTYGFNQAVVSKMRTPFLMVTGEHDKQVAPERVHQLYDDLGSKQKVIIDLACSSHNAMWEANHLLLFKASLDWIRDGRVEGRSEGALRLGFR